MLGLSWLEASGGKVGGLVGGCERCGRQRAGCPKIRLDSRYGGQQRFQGQ